MLLENHISSISIVIGDSQFFEFLLSETDQRLHELEPDQTSFRDQSVTFVIGSRHRICGNKRQVSNLERCVLVDDLCLLAKLSERIARNSPNVPEWVPRAEILVKVLDARVSIP